MTSPQPISDQVRLIVVPVSNPTTAPHLLKLATTLIDQEKGRIVALFVVPENIEDESETIAEIEPIIQQFSEDNCPVELVTHPASGIARGILDVARELRADLLILGVQNPRKGEFDIGPVTRGVTAAAPCDVLIFAARRDPSFKRVIVPVDGSEDARIGCRVALHVADGFSAPMEAILVQRSGHSQWEGRARIEQSLADLPGSDSVKRTLVTANDPASGILARVNEDDLVVLGFGSRQLLQKWLFSRFSDRLLNGLPGPVILTSALIDGQNGLARGLQRRLSWVRPTLTELEQDALVWIAAEMATPTLDFFVLAVVAALIASAGLLLNSAAVIIGAMLVAPFMQPLIAFSIGLTTGRIELMRRAVPTVLMGVGVALLIAFVFGLMVGTDTPTPEMLSRSHPSFLDAAVAITAGVIAAYATARKDIPAALAGVAIAAALMPPVCTIGLALSARQYPLAAGATLLFVTNIVFITLAGWVVFFWMGMRPRLVNKSRRRQYLSWALVTILALPILLLLLNLTNREGAASIVATHLQTAFAPAELVDLRVDDTGTLNVLATLRSPDPITPEQVAQVQRELAQQLKEPVALQVVVESIISPPAPKETPFY